MVIREPKLRLPRSRRLVGDPVLIPYGSDRIGQKGRSASAPSPSRPLAALDDGVDLRRCDLDVLWSAPVCGPHRKASSPPRS
jgi:hypothetical protein